MEDEEDFPPPPVPTSSEAAAVPVEAEPATFMVESPPEESTTELTVLKPVTYDIADPSDSKSEIFNKVVEQDSSAAAAADDDDEQYAAAAPNTVKMNGDFSDGRKTPDSSPSSGTPGKSRYGRVRKPKLSCDFVSVDKKSFAVLNSSSYEHVYADETPHKIPNKRKTKRSYRRSKNVLLIQEQPAAAAAATITKELQPKDSYLSQNVTLNATTTTITAGDEDGSTISSLISKDAGTIKTYSRKSDSFVSSSLGLSDMAAASLSTPPLPEGGESIDEPSGSGTVPPIELNWKVGDVAWAKIGCNPFWPSIVTLEYGSSIYVKSVGNRNRLVVHVQFFGDRGRRSWVRTTSLLKYECKQQFLDLKEQYRKDKIRLKYFIIRPGFQELWDKGVTEADTILKLPNEERIQYYQSIYPVSADTYVAELKNLNKSKERKKSKNPEEKRGRKRKNFHNVKSGGRIKRVNLSLFLLISQVFRQDASLWQRSPSRGFRYGPFV